MGRVTEIEWTDATWNPVTGCDPISPGCLNCYAEGIANRFIGKAFPNGFKVTLRPERLEDPLKWSDPLKVFTGSMTDLFHKDIPFDYLDRIFDTMRRAPWLTFQILTKRVDRMAEYFATRPPACWPFKNVWLGFTAENQLMFDKRLEVMQRIPAAVRFVSYEPALGPIDMARAFQLSRYGMTNIWLHARPAKGTPIDWVIAGGESGGSARVPNPDWFRLVRDQCRAAGVPFFFKQWGSWGPDHQGGTIPMTRVAVFHPDDTGNRPIYMRDLKPAERGAWSNPAPGDVAMYKVGKKAAGAELDGVEYKEFPIAGRGDDEF